MKYFYVLLLGSNTSGSGSSSLRSGSSSGRIYVVVVSGKANSSVRYVLFPFSDVY